MKKYILIGLLLLSIPVYAQDKVTEEERLKLENYILKADAINRDLESLYNKSKMLAEDYQNYFNSIKKKYNKDNYDVNVLTGEFTPKKEK